MPKLPKGSAFKYCATFRKREETDGVENPSVFNWLIYEINQIELLFKIFAAVKPRTRNFVSVRDRLAVEVKFIVRQL